MQIEQATEGARHRRFSNFELQHQDQLRALLRQSWRETYGNVLTEDQLKFLLASLDEYDIGGLIDPDPTNSDIRGILCWHGKELIGSLFYKEVQDIAYLWGFYLLNAYQRQGIGHAMLDQMKSNLKTAKFIELQVQKTSIKAVNFYKKYGFKIIEEDKYEIIIGHNVDVFIMGYKI